MNFLLLARRKRSLRRRASSMWPSLSQNAHLLFCQLLVTLRTRRELGGRHSKWHPGDESNSGCKEGVYETYLTSLGKSGMKHKPPTAQVTVIKPLMICHQRPSLSWAVLNRQTYKHPPPSRHALGSVQRPLNGGLQSARQQRADYRHQRPITYHPARDSRRRCGRRGG